MAITRTKTEEPQMLASIQLRNLDDKQAQHFSSSKAALDQNVRTPSELERSRSSSPETARLHPPLQKWNEPRGNIARFAASFYSMFVFGLSDAAYGALIPYVRPLIQTACPLQTLPLGTR